MKIPHVRKRLESALHTSFPSCLKGCALFIYNNRPLYRILLFSVNHFEGEYSKDLTNHEFRIWKSNRKIYLTIFLYQEKSLRYYLRTFLITTFMVNSMPKQPDWQFMCLMLKHWSALNQDLNISYRYDQKHVFILDRESHSIYIPPCLWVYGLKFRALKIHLFQRVLDLELINNSGCSNMLLENI